jgi:hypothetical protein
LPSQPEWLTEARVSAGNVERHDPPLGEAVVDRADLAFLVFVEVALGELASVERSPARRAPAHDIGLERRHHRHQHIGASPAVSTSVEPVDLERRLRTNVASAGVGISWEIGKVAKSLPASALDRVNRPPSCIPSPDRREPHRPLSPPGDKAGCRYLAGGADHPPWVRLRTTL